LLALSGAESTSRGVDSIGERDAIQLAETAYDKCHIPGLGTGDTDAVVPSRHKSTLHNAHSRHGRLPRSGSLLGAVILAFIAKDNDVNNAVTDAVSYYNLCAEAAGENNTAGPGTFIPNYIDLLYSNDDDILKDKVVKFHE